MSKQNEKGSSESFIDEFVMINLHNEDSEPQKEDSPKFTPTNPNSRMVESVTFRCHGEPLEVSLDLDKLRKSPGQVAEFAALFDINKVQRTCHTRWSRKALEVVVNRWAFNKKTWTMDEDTSFELLALAANGGRGSGKEPFWPKIAAAAQAQLVTRLTLLNCLDFHDKAIHLEAHYLCAFTQGLIKENLNQLSQNLHTLSPPAKRDIARWLTTNPKLPDGKMIDVVSVVNEMNFEEISEMIN
ncbi:hypothetical protein HDE_08267 [Halotydeus destructor]|nr:hypothetical protein HDE_08267 [Halotydeus destructor]